MSEPKSEWTPWAEAISFVSATLGDTFVAAQGNGLYWDFAAPLADGTHGYSVSLERIGDEVKVTVYLEYVATGHSDLVKLYAIVGWAHAKQHMLEVV